jgi:DNA polymerase-4
MDMDAFFVEVELLKRPELRGEPVIVGGSGDPTQRGVVSTASYEARQYGIGSGMPLRTAFARCPEAVFLPVDYSSYSAASRRIKAILSKFSPIMEDVGIDEAYLDISDLQETSIAIAQSLKQEIKSRTGLTCSVGIAPNKLLAKIASDLDKPDGLTVITQDDIETRIWPLPARRLWGVGPKSAEKLTKIGVEKIGELAGLPKETLIACCGRSQGNYLYQAARGIDERPLVTHRKPKSIGRETTFQRDVSDRPTLEAKLIGLTKDVVSRMRSRGLRAKTITVKLRYSDFDTHTHAISLTTPTNRFATIQETALFCLSRFELTKKVRLIGVRVDGLAQSPQDKAVES